MDILKLMYEHWLVTSLWMYLLCPWNVINLVVGNSKERKMQPPRAQSDEMPDGVPVREDSAGHGIL